MDHTTQDPLPSGFCLVSTNLEALANDHRKEREREVRIFISPFPILPPPACLWLLAVTSFLYLRPWFQSYNPISWQVLAGSSNCFPLSLQTQGWQWCPHVMSPWGLYSLLVPLKPAHISVNSLFINLSSVYPLSVPFASCQAPQQYTQRNKIHLPLFINPEFYFY